MTQDDFIFFFKKEETPYGFFSQWAETPFQDLYNLETYYTAEHFMMHRKLKVFDPFWFDNPLNNKILKTKHPAEVKKLGRLVPNFNEKIWNNVKYEIVLLGNYYKFVNYPEFYSLLYNTGTKIIAEASPHDHIWGIGLSQDDPKILDRSNWLGQNLLGVVLMTLRYRFNIYNKYNILRKL